jgi:hypothetical protein
MGYFFIIFLLGISIITFFIWFFKETWNDRGIKGELEEANMLKRLELQQKYYDNQLKELLNNNYEEMKNDLDKTRKETNSRIKEIDKKHLESIKDDNLRKKLSEIKEKQYMKFNEIDKKTNEEFDRLHKETMKKIGL